LPDPKTNIDSLIFACNRLEDTNIAFSCHESGGEADQYPFLVVLKSGPLRSEYWLHRPHSRPHSSAIRRKGQRMSDYEERMKIKNLTRKCKKQGLKLSREIERVYWAEDKWLDRSSRCTFRKGAAIVRCMEDCSKCSRQRDGAPLSLDDLEESGEYFICSSSVEEDIIKSELLNALANALGTLSEQERNILIMYYVEGKSQRAIGEKMGLPQTTVSKHIQKILAKLYELLKDYR